MTNINPYESLKKTEACTTRATPWRIWPNNWTLFVVIVLATGIPSLFIPTIEMFKGTMSLGRAPVFLAYIGMLMPEYWVLALQIAIAHLLGTIIIASTIERLIWKRMSGAQSVHDIDPQDFREKS